MTKKEAQKNSKKQKKKAINKARLIRSTAVLASVLIVIGIGLYTYYEVSFSKFDVYFVNGYSNEIEITVDDQNLEIGPQTYKMLELQPGQFSYKTDISEESTSFEVDSPSIKEFIKFIKNKPFYIVNPNSRALLADEEFVYNEDLERGNNIYTNFFFNEFVKIDHKIDYLFTPTPQEIEQKSYDKSNKYTSLDIYPTEGYAENLETATIYNVNKSENSEYYLKNIRGNLLTHRYAAQLFANSYKEPIEIENFAKSLITAPDPTLENYYLYQKIESYLNSPTMYVDEFTKLYLDHSKSIKYNYLLGELLREKDGGKEQLEKVIADDKDNFWANTSLALTAYNSGEWEDVLTYLKTVNKQANPADDIYLTMYINSLIANKEWEELYEISQDKTSNREKAPKYANLAALSLMNQGKKSLANNYIDSLIVVGQIAEVNAEVLKSEMLYMDPDIATVDVSREMLGDTVVEDSLFYTPSVLFKYLLLNNSPELDAFIEANKDSLTEKDLWMFALYKPENAPTLPGFEGIELDDLKSEIDELLFRFGDLEKVALISRYIYESDVTQEKYLELSQSFNVTPGVVQRFLDTLE